MDIVGGLSLFFGPAAWPGAHKWRSGLNGVGMRLFLHGRADFSFDVVGVARHRTALREIAARWHWIARRHECVATLILVPGKAYEKNRVAVEIGGVMVGYCPSYLATRFREWMQHWQFSDALVRCRAIFTSEGTGPDGELARVRVKLDIELPFKVTRL